MYYQSPRSFIRIVFRVGLPVLCNPNLDDQLIEFLGAIGSPSSSLPLEFFVKQELSTITTWQWRYDLIAEK